MGTRAVLVTTAAVVGLAACGGGGGSNSSGTSATTAGTVPGILTTPSTKAGAATTSPTTAAAKGGSTPSTAAGSGGGTSGNGTVQTGVVTTPDSSTYKLTLTKATTPGPCAVSGRGGAEVSFAVSITNATAAAEPLARLGLSLMDPAPSAAQAVVAISYQGVCLNFTEPGGTLSPGQTVTYNGTVSGATATSTLVANVISTPDNTTLGTVTLALKA